MRNAEIRIERDRLVIAGDCVFVSSDAVQRGASVEPVGRRIWIECKGALKARQGFAVPPEFAQHVGAVAVGSCQFGVAFNRIIEALQGVFDLAHPVQGLTDQIVRARLSRAKRQ